MEEQKHVSHKISKENEASDMTGNEKKVHWDESGMTNVNPGVFEFRFSRNEFVLLLGKEPSEYSDPETLRVQALSRIVMNPFTAKQLADALNRVIRECESRYGERDLYPPIPPRPKQPSTDPEIPSSSLPVESGEAEALIFRIVKGLNAEAGFERSFKIGNGVVLNNRFLLGISKEAVGRQMADDRFIESCGLMGMPKTLLDTFKQYLPQGNYIHFGFEKNESAIVYKVYLEFFDAIKKEIKESRDRPGSLLLHIGLKWDVGNPSRQSVTRYTWYPWLPSHEIMQRLSRIPGAGPGSAPGQAGEQLISLALARIPDRDILYLEVTEDGNPRRSFDINVYRADLQLAEIYPLLSMLCRRHSIPYDSFHGLYEGIKTKRLGHLAGGVDRNGNGFFTVYYGVEEKFGERSLGGTAHGDKSAAVPSRYSLPARKLRVTRIEETDDKARHLFQLVKDLRLQGGFEHSLKFLKGVILCDRFLFGVKRPIGSTRDDDAIMNICRQIDMPSEFREIFQSELHKANFALFGFEKNEEDDRIYKAYLEFTGSLAEAIRQEPRPENVLIYSGFKWDISDRSRKVLTDYYAYPLFLAEEMAARVSVSIYGALHKNPFPIVDDILDLAGSRTQPGELLYFEATESGNPRKSFDINMYLADLRMAEIYPLFLRMARHYSIDLDMFDELYEGLKDQKFGHLSGGIDRKGRDFLTVYFSHKGSSRPYLNRIKKG